MVVLLAIAACDSGTEPSAEVRLLHGFANVTLEVGRDLTIDVAPRFETSSPSETLTYRHQVEGEGVEAEMEGSVLTLRATGPGPADAIVFARAEGGQAASDTFRVFTRSDCPWGPQEGEVDYLPLAEGEVWEFEYQVRTRRLASRVSESGTLAVSLQRVTCEDGTRSVYATERRVGIRESSFPLPDGTQSRDTTFFDENRDVSFIESSEGVQLPWTSGFVPRYHTGSEPVNVPLPFAPVCGPGAAMATLVPGGLVEFTGDCGHSSSRQHLHFERSSPAASVPF